MTQPTITAPPLRSELLLESIASGKLTEAVVASLFLASQNWLAHGGRVSMERYLRLPTTGPQLTRASRNLWLRRASKLIQAEGRFLKAGELHRELNTFVTRSAWQTWKNLVRPPEDASELRKALFYVVKFSSGKVPSEITIWRAIA